MTDASPSHATSTAAYRQHVDEAAASIREALDTVPRIGIILGTGLGALGESIEAEVTLSYEDIPHAPVSTVQSHHGRLIAGTLRGVPVLAMQGRFHLYEGYSARTATLLIRAMGVLGVETLLISNAAGGMNPHFRESDIMLITDHVNLQGDNPLVGPNVDDWGPRFPDMSAPYDAELRAQAQQHALDQGLKLQQGVYAAVVGPNLETKAEYRMLRRLGIDAVGMSTVPEVIVARHMGLRVMAASVITDECFPDALEPVQFEDVLAAADRAAPHLSELMASVVASIGHDVTAA